MESGRVHGYLERRLADVPVDGRPVVVRLRARRMRCLTLGCSRQTFREQPTGVTQRYQLHSSVGRPGGSCCGGAGWACRGSRCGRSRCRVVTADRLASGVTTAGTGWPGADGDRGKRCRSPQAAALCHCDHWGSHRRASRRPGRRHDRHARSLVSASIPASGSAAERAPARTPKPSVADCLTRCRSRIGDTCGTTLPKTYSPKSPPAARAAVGGHRCVDERRRAAVAVWPPRSRRRGAASVGAVAGGTAGSSGAGGCRAGAGVPGSGRWVGRVRARRSGLGTDRGGGRFPRRVVVIIRRRRAATSRYRGPVCRNSSVRCGCIPALSS